MSSFEDMMCMENFESCHQKEESAQLKRSEKFELSVWLKVLILYNLPTTRILPKTRSSKYVFASFRTYFIYLSARKWCMDTSPT